VPTARLTVQTSAYPNLLAGDQVGGDEPRRWLLISREVPVASDEEGSGRWSVDHLFLDQYAVPTIVEVKRSTDTRIRREVVGQMLDYAANAVVYWPIEALALVRKELWAQEQTFYGSPWEADTIKVPRVFMERLTEAVCYAA
jgi:hypothetical protein